MKKSIVSKNQFLSFTMLYSVRPQSDLLKKFIEVFYYFKENSNDTISYLAFPHINTGISLFKGAKISRQNHHINIEATNTSDYTIEILGKYTQPVLVSYSGKVEEIAIIFKPLGINRFINTPYHELAQNFSQTFQDKIWQNFAQFYFENNCGITEIEQFLLNQLFHHPEFDLIEKALKLFDENQHLSIEGISRELSIHPKTFQRQFLKHIGCSPIAYKRILRLRKSINERLLSNETPNFTDITHNNFYYDQAYFIKEFKKMTGKNPKSFFKKTQLVDDNKIIWELK